MMADILLLLVGLVVLIVGGEFLVRGAVSLASRAGMPKFLIGLTVVGFGTSMPEMLVSVQAVLTGAPDIALGNVVGSNIANTLLIIGMSGLIWPIAARIKGLGRDLIIMLIVSVAVLALGFSGAVTTIAGAVMLAALIAYLTYVTFNDREQLGDDDTKPKGDMPLPMEIAALVGGLAALFLGADLLVDSAVSIARSIGVSEAVIGLTIVAFGTSLPELATSVIAAFRRHSEVALGNVVGSNIFNLFGIMAVTAIIRPLPVSNDMAYFDIPFMVATSFALAAIAFFFGKIGRVPAFILLALYVGYTVHLFTSASPALPV